MAFRKFAGLIALVMCIALFSAGECCGALTISADFAPVLTIGTAWEGKFTAAGEEIESCKWSVKLLSGFKLKIKVTGRDNPMTLTAEAYTGTAIGTVSFTVTCIAITAGRKKVTASETYKLTVKGTGDEDNLTISADFPPVYVAGTPWEGKFTATGGGDLPASGYKWQLRSNINGMKITKQGNPITLSISDNNKIESGTASFTLTCTAAKTAGRPYQLTVTEDYGLTVYALNFQQEISGSIKPELSFSFTGFTGSDYSRTLQAYGLPEPFTLSLADGALPPGMSMTFSGDMATLSGTPTKAGKYSYTIGAAFSNDLQAKANFSATIYPGDKITILDDASFASKGYEGRKYISSINVIGTAGAYSSSVTSGMLPPGLSVSNHLIDYDEEAGVFTDD